MTPSILFVHFRVNRKWSANAMCVLHHHFPAHYAIDNIVRHFDDMTYAKREDGDEMTYLFDVIGESNALCLHTPNPFQLYPFQQKLLDAATALSVPVWCILDDLTLLMNFNLNPELITCRDIPLLKPSQAWPITS